MTAQADETSRAGAAAAASGAERPLRRDAERNRRRILAAAGEVFTERGLDATLDEVARVAGVGIGTVYRRFPDKEALVTALFRERIDALVTVAEEACAAADPWQGLTAYIDYAASAMAADLGLRQLMMFGTYDRDQVCYARDRMGPVLSRLVQRAQSTGDLRPDFAHTDIKMITFMLGSIAEYADAVTPAIWRRYLTLLIDGLRPARAGVSPLPVPAPTPDQLGELMQARRAAPPPRGVPQRPADPRAAG